MTSLVPPLHVGKSRRRFVTFGGALILAACLTLVKMTMVTLDMKSGEADLWSLLDEPLPSHDRILEPNLSKEESSFAWPTVLPEPAAGPTGEQDDGRPSAGDPTSEGEPMSGGETPSALDPSSLTEGQIQALRELAARRQALDERERLLDMRAELNGKTEKRLDQQIQQLSALKEQLEALVEGLDEDEERKLVRLVKIYETMKPKSAAEIFNRLEIPILLHVVERMKEAKSAVVLGKMDPAIAKRVTTELARRKQRPTLGDQDLGS